MTPLRHSPSSKCQSQLRIRISLGFLPSLIASSDLYLNRKYFIQCLLNRLHYNKRGVLLCFSFNFLLLSSRRFLLFYNFYLLNVFFICFANCFKFSSCFSLYLLFYFFLLNENAAAERKNM